MTNRQPYLEKQPGDKAPLYHAAFRAYIEREVAPTPSALALEFGVHPVGICTCMDRQHWPAARIMFWSARAAQNGVHLDQLAGQMQDQLCEAFQTIYRKLLPAIAETLEVVAQLPIAPPTTGQKRGKSAATLSRTKLELLKLGTQTLHQATDGALAIGLVLPVRGGKYKVPERSAGMVDLSMTLHQALGQDPAKTSTVAPDPAAPVEFEVEEPN